MSIKTWTQDQKIIVPYTLNKLLETLTLGQGCFPLDLRPDRLKSVCKLIFMEIMSLNK